MPRTVIPENPDSETQPRFHRPPPCSPQQGELFVWFCKSQLNAKQEPARSRACQRQSIPFLPFPVVPVAVLDPASVWVGFKSSLTGPTGDCDASPCRELWKMVSGSALAWLGWHSPTNGALLPMDFPSSVPKEHILQGSTAAPKILMV